VVADAAWATPLTVPAIRPLPVAASETLRFISAVVAPCSSTAEAMVSWKSLIWPVIVATPLIAVVALAVSAWMASTRRARRRRRPGPRPPRRCRR
jgi:hypothetical protein